MWRAQADDGQATVLVALTLVALLGALALAVDLGRGILTQFRMQAATDAAALAGASALPTDPGRAQTLALQLAQINGVAAPKVEVGSDGATITVQDSQTLPTLLARLLGVLDIPVAVASRARAGGYPTCWGWSCSASYDVPSTVTDSPSVAQVVSDGQLTACPQVLVGGSFHCLPPGTDQLGLAPLYVDASVIAADFAPGGCAESADGCAPYEIKSGTDGEGDGSNRGAMEIDGPGASTYAWDLGHGGQAAVSIGQTITTEPGVLQGPTDDGLDTLCTADGSRPYVVIPVVTPPGEGRETLVVQGFAVALLQCPGAGNGSIFGQFVAALLPGWSGTPLVGGSGDFGLLVRAGLIPG